MPLLDVNEVMARVPLGRTAIYENVKRGRFPEPVRIGGRKIRWRESDIDLYLNGKWSPKEASAA